MSVQVSNVFSFGLCMLCPEKLTILLIQDEADKVIGYEIIHPRNVLEGIGWSLRL